MRRDSHDPYAAPPRHKERSGGVVRFAVIAALLGAAAWGYMEYAQQPQTALVEPAEEEVAENQSYVTPAAPATGAPQATTPAEVPEKAAEPPA
jgi:hypothetical protein